MPIPIQAKRGGGNDEDVQQPNRQRQQRERGHEHAEPFATPAAETPTGEAATHLSRGILPVDGSTEPLVLVLRTELAVCAFVELEHLGMRAC
ncbi:MAG: hypothetical protein ACXVH1_39420 [Solirubrobacteraceae bacterium]